MTIGLAQVRSETGRLDRNLDHHLGVLRALRPGAADLVVFPELSLSNYDPEAAGAAALDPSGARLGPLQAFADATGTAVAVGCPTPSPTAPRISMVVFAPGQARTVLHKQHLHPDEEPFFAPGPEASPVLNVAARLGVAICYEITVPAHTEAALGRGTDVYLASVAKTPRGVAEAEATLAATARRYGAPALLVNSVGTCEGERAGGGSFALGPDGRLLARLGPEAEGVLLVETASGTARAAPLLGVVPPADV